MKLSSVGAGAMFVAWVVVTTTESSAGRPASSGSFDVAVPATRTTPGAARVESSTAVQSHVTAAG